MAFQFPINPTIGQQIVNTGSNQIFTWNGQAWVNQPGAVVSAISASFAQTASYYNPRLNIEKVSNMGCNGALLLAEGKIYMFRGATGGLDFYPFGLWSGSSYTETSAGIPQTTEIPFPDETGSIVDIGTYGNSAYALFTNGNLYTWGENNYGQLGNGNTTNVFIPILATNNVVQVYETVNSLSELFTYSRLLIKKTDGKVYGCGYNGQGALGLGDNSNRTIFTEMTGIGTNPLGVWNINGYDGWVIAQKSNGDVVVAGAGGYGNMGITAGNYNTFQLANGWKNGFTGAVIQKIRGSANYSNGSGAQYSANMNVWIKNGTDSYVMFAGYGLWGNAGNNTTSNVVTPVAATIGTTNIIDFERTGPSPGYCYVLLGDNTVKAWGYNANGQLGTGNNNTQPLPVQVFTGAVAFYGGNQNYNNYNLYCPSITIKKSDNTYWRAGANGYCQLGVGDGTQKAVFTEMIFPNGFTMKILGGICVINDAGAYFAVSTENKIYGWGYNVENTIIDSSGGSNIAVPQYTPALALLR